VTDSARTCRAELHDGILTLQVPAEEPNLKVVCRIGGSATLPEAVAGWKQMMAEEADGFEVRIYAS